MSTASTLLQLQGICVSYGPVEAVHEVNLDVKEGEIVTVIGPNGAGKTTLLRLILGELAPDAGTARLGTRLQVAYFDQFRTQLDEEAALVDVISPGSDYVEIGRERKHVIGYLGDFLFAPQRARSPVKSLSGGERNRLLLARLFARPANVLVLDEPTNDLDIDTLELLEELLQTYDGTVFLVSHDRAFLDNVVTSTIACEGDGLWREYEGGVTDWMEQSRRSKAMAEAAQAKSAPREEPKPVASRTDAAASPKKKLSYKDQRELEALPATIAALETEQKQIQQALADGSLFASDNAKAVAMHQRDAEIDEALMEALERWTSLSA